MRRSVRSYKFSLFFATASLLVVCFILPRLWNPKAHAAIDERLVGRWARGGYGVGVSGGYGDTFILTLGADGKAVVTNIQGCMVVSEPAIWAADGRELHVAPVKKLKREEPGRSYTYSVDGEKHKVNHWQDQERVYGYSADDRTLRLTIIDKTMVLTRRK
jgi:hypothetical protein